MGKSYSVNGYLNAVVRRTVATFLVEGPSDRGVICRLLSDQTASAHRQIVVDHAALISDGEASGLGAKAKVLAVSSAAASLADRFPKLAQQLGTLVDREWDGLTLEPAKLVTEWQAPTQGHARFVTLGHSIENYNFDRDCILRYLRFGFAEYFSAALEEIITVHYDACLALAGALSFIAQSDGTLSRLGGLLEHQHIERQGTALVLAHGFDAAAAVREISQPEAFRQRVNAATEGWQELIKTQHARWVLHGHIGAETIWACVGHLALASGLPVEIARQITRGNKNERRRFWNEWIATAGTVESRAPLDQAIKWLSGNSGTSSEPVVPVGAVAGIEG